MIETQINPGTPVGAAVRDPAGFVSTPVLPDNMPQTTAGIGTLGIGALVLVALFLASR
jgi:hypothetical protein